MEFSSKAEGSKFMQIFRMCRIWVIDSKSRLRALFEVEMEQKAPFCKAESLRNPIAKELAPEDASISRYGDLKSAPWATIQEHHWNWPNSLKSVYSVNSIKSTQFSKTSLHYPEIQMHI